eukprot:CAMPEP_0206585902 /NCGR_PEP_ID=MMETSP0325_2-20121206/36695_1 /ASSEMBLY_ACC=CAM_ASM_000347 /TAXON_ID=2866 /ORGANISM="Crypthecodinium cohnii, Strain Seligo" /LENGTH=84 /DNA_ID=CAMNT_0054093541 /DNA_START=328 /DNA_END=582 /DNA_ORIENTATION=-
MGSKVARFASMSKEGDLKNATANERSDDTQHCSSSSGSSRNGGGGSSKPSPLTVSTLPQTSSLVNAMEGRQGKGKARATGEDQG